MRWLFLVLLGGCATVRPAVVTEPVLLAAASRPVPFGMAAVDPAMAEMRVCGPEYVGLHDLISRAQRDGDALLELTVDLERHYYVYRPWWDKRGRHEEAVFQTQCYALRAYRVRFVPRQ